jgi:hypothetical protein
MTEPYQPSGLLDVSRLTLAVLGLLLVAAVCAMGLGVATAEGWYLLALVPAAATLPLALAGYPAAQWAHVRNPGVAAAVGGALGVVMYLGQYYFIMVHDLGTEAILRLDILPAFFIECVNHQIIGNDWPPGEPSPWLNWSIFAIELAMCASIGASLWYLAAGRPYCERCQRWMTRHTTILRGGCVRHLADAFASGDFASLPTLEPVVSERPERYGELEVTGCLHDGAGDDATFFVTVKEVQWEDRRRRTTTFVDRRGVTPEELVTLADRCPGMLG